MIKHGRQRQSWFFIIHLYYRDFGLQIMMQGLFGIEAPQDHRKRNINDTSCILKSKMAAIGHIGKQVLLIAQTLFVI